MKREVNIAFDNHFEVTLGANLAPKGEDHDNVLRMMYNQMNILRNGGCEKMFYAKENRMVVPIFPYVETCGSTGEKRYTEVKLRKRKLSFKMAVCT